MVLRRTTHHHRPLVPPPTPAVGTSKKKVRARIVIPTLLLSARLWLTLLSHLPAPSAAGAPPRRLTCRKLIKKLHC